jgi:hypothetical protein
VIQPFLHGKPGNEKAQQHHPSFPLMSFHFIQKQQEVVSGTSFQIQSTECGRSCPALDDCYDGFENPPSF